MLLFHSEDCRIDLNAIPEILQAEVLMLTVLIVVVVYHWNANNRGHGICRTSISRMQLTSTLFSSFPAANRGQSRCCAPSPSTPWIRPHPGGRPKSTIDGLCEFKSCGFYLVIATPSWTRWHLALPARQAERSEAGGHFGRPRSYVLFHHITDVVANSLVFSSSAVIC